MLYYSHVNEDNSVEREIVLRIKPSTIFCITGSGERLIALMDSSNLQKIVAVDINPEAQFLLDLKLTALKNLDIETYLCFIGYNGTADNRVKIFNGIGNCLMEDTFNYWTARLPAIETGILYSGYFENYLEKLRPLASWFLGKSFYRCFSNNTDYQIEFPKRRWNSFLKILSSNFFFKFSGNKDIAFNSPDCDCKIIATGLQKTMEDNNALRSFMFNLIFKGHLREMDIECFPPSLQPEVLNRIKQKLIEGSIRLVFLTKDLNLALTENTHEITENTFFSLSDILSFTPPEYLLRVFINLKETGLLNLNGVFRSFLRNSISINAFPADLVSSLKDISESEMTNMYKVYYFSI